MSSDYKENMHRVTLPEIGLGTWANTDPAACAASVSEALTMGYRFIDTAQAYRNEAHVGKGIAQAEVQREHIIVGTKVWRSNLSYSKVLKSTEVSLQKMGLDFVDILYIHWPALAFRKDRRCH